MTRNPDAVCGNCPYRDSKNKCRRNPPVFYAYGEEHGSNGEYHYTTESDVTWPSVKDDDWCGEHPDFDISPAIFRKYIEESE